LRRSADRLSNNESGLSSGQEPVVQKSRKRHSSSSSNDLNTSRPDGGQEDEYTRLACNGIDTVPKVCNLQPSASDDEYARVKVNNLDVSVDSGKCGAYSKFDDDFNVTSSSLLEDSNGSIACASGAEETVFSSEYNS
ncbi:hypothetical protein SK128_023707, partial [Halocaridina rubra]